MTLNTWSFSKKKNSTARPSGSGNSYNVRLKEDTSIEKPTFIIGTGIDADINYCQFAGNYYFIDDIEVLTNDQVALHCSIDVLATHKSSIGAYRAFVRRSSYESDPWLIDDALSVEQHIVSETMATTDLFTANQTGCFIVRCVSPSDAAPTGIASYVMNHAELKILLDFITTESNFSDMFDDVVVKSFFNPFQYILSIMWFPISKDNIPGTAKSMKLGWWTVSTFKELTSTGYYANVTVNKPTTYYSNDFRVNSKRFTELRAYIPALGVVELPPEALSASLNAEVSIDYVTGTMQVGFYDRGTQGGLTVNRDNFGTFSTQLGVPIQCGQTSALQSAAGITSGGVLGSLAEATLQAADITLGGVSGIFRGASGQQNVMGSTGNMSILVAHPRLILYQRAYGCGEFPGTWYGKPLCKSRVLSNIPGYIKCDAASISLAAPDTEVEAVNNYLNTGFYYE